ncbi:hypothetical protein V6N13_095425 [Hibiscus sabdariffa]|uniref:Uncharacterized protein n=1 Tax=Hibiscus sabdariffa TaxID=183260 RepID=A0ABR2PS45_9ROSI
MKPHESVEEAVACAVREELGSKQQKLFSHGNLLGHSFVPMGRFQHGSIKSFASPSVHRQPPALNKVKIDEDDPCLYHHRDPLVENHPAVYV